MQTNINMNRYVSITSGLAAGQGVKTRELIGNFVTTSPELPTQSMITFDVSGGVNSVGEYFGFTSLEYKHALSYAGYVSKEITKPSKIMYSSFAAADTTAKILGDKLEASDLAKIKAVTAGGFTISLAGTEKAITGIDHSSDADFAAVASALQTKIQAAGDPFDSATVTYNSAMSRLDLDTTALGAIDIKTSVGGELEALGWSNPRLSNGIEAQTPVEAMSLMIQESNNFGSFMFINGLTLDQSVEVAQWNKSQNVMFTYHVPVESANASDASLALKGVGSTAMTLWDSSNGEYPYIIPMAAMAATNYDRLNSTINYMFLQHDSFVTPLVTTDADATTYDNLRINYYGRTQTAGVTYNFYQRGALCGSGTDITAMNTHANEQWLKSKAQSDLMALMLATKIPANDAGLGKFYAIMQGEGGVIQLSKKNGTISVGRKLNQIQKVKVQDMTGSATAYLQIESTGFWLQAELVSYVDGSGNTEWKISYVLLYAKDDVVNKIEGTHALL